MWLRDAASHQMNMFVGTTSQLWMMSHSLAKTWLCPRASHTFTIFCGFATSNGERRSTLPNTLWHAFSSAEWAVRKWQLTLSDWELSKRDLRDLKSILKQKRTTCRAACRLEAIGWQVVSAAPPCHSPLWPLSQYDCCAVYFFLSERAVPWIPQKIGWFKWSSVTFVMLTLISPSIPKRLSKTVPQVESVCNCSTSLTCCINQTRWNELHKADVQSQKSARRLWSDSKHPEKACWYHSHRPRNRSHQDLDWFEWRIDIVNHGCQHLFW